MTDTGRVAGRRRFAALMLVGAGVILLALLSVFAIELSGTQAKSKSDVKARVHERAVLAGALVDSLFQAVLTQVPTDARRFGGKVVSARLAEAARQENRYAAVLDAGGRVLASSAGFTPQVAAEVPRSAAVTLVRAGRPYGLGTFVRFGGRTGSALDVAVAFPTAYGRRILVTGVPPMTLSALLTGELLKVPGVTGAHNYLLDSNNTVLASSNPAIPAGHRFDTPEEVEALSQDSGDRHGHYYDQVRLANSTWRIVLTAPDGPLFASVSGLRKWVPWGIFLAFAFVAAAALVLGRRTLSSAERRLSEANRASAMKSSFVANMSHEIRTPLNGVVGMLALLGETPLTAEQREYVDVARSSSDALMSVINDILDIERIEAGRLQIETSDFDLHDAIEASCEMVAASAAAKGIELQSLVRDDVPRAVRGDRMRLSQILLNLIGNAVKFTSEGEVVATATVAGRDGETTRVRFEVRDTGIGIAPERIDGMFEAFSQADLSTTRTFGGTGLGLAICRELTRLMGGTIGAESELGRGSLFWFELPFSPAGAESSAPIEVRELHEAHVLVADANTTTRRVLETYVRSWGLRPETVSSAGDAVSALHGAAQRGDPFEIVLIDEELRVQAGAALAPAIASAPATAPTRLIRLTSSSPAGPEEADAGEAQLVLKPVRRSRLLDAITAAMAIPVPGREAPSEPGEPARAPDDQIGKAILVAEDQPVNWLLIERMLVKRGHRAENAADGRSALAMLAEGRYDLVLMDCQMPVLDGYDTAREIRRRESEAGDGHIPIIAMTANAMQGDREECLAAGMDDYLAKPISAEKLDRLLSAWLPRVAGRAQPARTSR